MSDRPDSWIPLLAHDPAQGGAVRRIDAWAELTARGVLRLRYLLDADLQRVRIPGTAAAGGRAERLWEHTCFEALVASDASPGYLELNFSPSAQWAAYRFESYRQGMAQAELSGAPQLSIRQGERQLELRAELRLAPPHPHAQGPARERDRLRLALCAVVEDDGGRLSYWALRHAPGRPDFHHPAAFSLELAPS